ncbi:hypothetical protein MD484_g5215, partial [Candolleomyces efflorescens]
MHKFEFFSNSRGIQAEKIKFVTNISSSAGGDPWEKLEAQIAPGAFHDSAERCDAPKCHPETRVAVQDDLYDWIINGDGPGELESEHPRKIKWVTGPAGCGKTAIMGSLAARCAANGVLGAAFFFASWSASVGRRRKTAFVATIASQLGEYREDLKDAIANAIERNPSVFNKNLHVQMEVLVSAPLREVSLQSNRPRLRGAIIVDGVDECEAEQYHDGSRANSPPARTNDQDQLEILQILQVASSDPSFPFRVLIASRPERVFRDFFEPEDTLAPFANKLDLHEHYNADADIALFFEAQFSRLRRRHNLPSSWPPPFAIQMLAENASGQFIYAATVVRFLEMPHREPTKALLDAILEIGATLKSTSNPLERLDALYAHILMSSPDPSLSIKWIRSIDSFSGRFLSCASDVNLLLQTDPDSNEAEHLLGDLHSLIQIPPPGWQGMAEYGFYHKSLLDFLKDPARCGRNMELFLKFLSGVPQAIGMPYAIPQSKARATLTGAAWWVSLAIEYQKEDCICAPCIVARRRVVFGALLF